MRLIVSVFLLAASFFVNANNAGSLVPVEKDVEGLNQHGQKATTAERGWFWHYWYQLQEEERKKELAMAEQQQREMKEKQEREKDPCAKDTWTVDCGFIEPKGDYEFMVKQREAIHINAAMNPNDSDSVKQLQKFNSWAINKALQMSAMWEYNQIQDQDLNPVLTSPIASFALIAMTDLRAIEQRDVFKQIKDQGGFFVWFTRSTCATCEIARPSVQGLALEMDIEIYEASFDGKCHAGFVGEYCHTEGVEAAGEQLGVRFVPDLWLYLPDQDGWIRVSSGVEARDMLKRRIQDFFGGVIKAVAEGMTRAKGQPLPVSFDKNIIEQSGGFIGMGIKEQNDEK